MIGQVVAMRESLCVMLGCRNLTASGCVIAPVEEPEFYRIAGVIRKGSYKSRAVCNSILKIFDRSYADQQLYQ